ncbi:lysoplasmalogenase family protein [Propionibacteriaceae bacterium Y1700]|uniref:lysoplasmalogenase family protein n=1 Tax=Microlunatus sp. Y1700 TaxID=3418487 RepID=UPI003DA76788
MGRAVTNTAVGLLVVTTAVHLWAQWSGPLVLLEVTLFLLMPLLIICVLAGTRRRTGATGVLVVALILSWFGDVSGTALVRGLLVDVGVSWAAALAAGAFLVKLVCFLLAHLAYIALFASHWRTSVVGRRRWRLIPYGMAVVVIVGVLLPYAAALGPAIVVYGVVIALMAAMATGLGRAATVGGVLFMFSDTLVAVQQFVPGVSVTLTGVLIMLTYVAAQALLAYGLVRHGNRR